MCNLTAWQRALEIQRRAKTDAMRERLGLPRWDWSSLERRNAAQATEKA